MAKSVSLPFEMPLFATTQGAAAAPLAMTGHPTAHIQMLIQTASLCCWRKFLKGHSTPLVSVFHIGIDTFSFMERYKVNCRHTKKYCLDIIKQMLDEHYYVYYSFVDDYYLPGKSWYGTRHFNHDGIICGYDDNDNTLSIAAYDINWVFRLIRVPQDCFMMGLESSLDLKRYGDLTAYKIKGGTTVEINESEMLKHLQEYMDSSLEKYPPDQEGAVKGLAVHYYLATYIEKLMDGSIPHEKMDWRALRPVWEHKRCMLMRIRAVEDKNGWGHELSQRYAPVAEKANQIRIMYAMYHKNRNTRLLDKIRAGLIDLAKSDEEILGEFINKLEECTL